LWETRRIDLITHFLDMEQEVVVEGQEAMAPTVGSPGAVEARDNVAVQPYDLVRQA
jgi:hypothetical protein